MDQIVALALAAVTIVKILVDLVKLGISTPQWLPPLQAVLAGPCVVALLMVATGQELTAQLVAQAILAGILAGGSAVGVTELQKRTLPGVK